MNEVLIDLKQIESSKAGFKNLYEQLEFGRFNAERTGAAPTLYEEQVAFEGQQEFILQKGTYVVGDYSLQVFVNGQHMRSGSDNDYEEIDNKTIRFTFELEEGDVVVFRVNGGTSGPALHENYQAQEGQTIFQLVSSYTVGNHSLLVFVNGAYQTIDVDYIEVDSKTVEFIEPLEANDLVTFRVEGIPSVSSKYYNHAIHRTYNANQELIREEIVGDDIHIIKEYYRDANGRPEKMIIKEAGFVITRIYTWDGERCINIEEQVREGS